MHYSSTLREQVAISSECLLDSLGIPNKARLESVVSRFSLSEETGRSVQYVGKLHSLFDKREDVSSMVQTSYLMLQTNGNKKHLKQIRIWSERD